MDQAEPEQFTFEEPPMGGGELGADGLGQSAGLAPVAGHIALGPNMLPASEPISENSPERESPLVGKQTEVLHLTSLGLRTEEIATKLDIEPEDVENHRRKAYINLGVRNQYRATIAAYKEGWLPPNPEPTEAASRVKWSKTQKAIVELAMGDLTGAEIASKVGLSLPRVNQHLRKVREGIGAINRVHLVRLILEMGGLEAIPEKSQAPEPETTEKAAPELPASPTENYTDISTAVVSEIDGQPLNSVEGKFGLNAEHLLAIFKANPERKITVEELGRLTGIRSATVATILSGGRAFRTRLVAENLEVIAHNKIPLRSDRGRKLLRKAYECRPKDDARIAYPEEDLGSERFRSQGILAGRQLVKLIDPNTEPALEKIRILVDRSKNNDLRMEELLDLGLISQTEFEDRDLSIAGGAAFLVIKSGTGRQFLTGPKRDEYLKELYEVVKSEFRVHFNKKREARHGASRQ